MKTVILKRNGKSIDMFEALGVIRNIQTYVATAVDEANYYILFFNFEIDNKHVYLTVAEPFFGVNNPSKKYNVIEIEELNLDVFIETDVPDAFFYSYEVKDKPIDDEIMLFDLLSNFLDLDEYQLEEEPDAVFIGDE